MARFKDREWNVGVMGLGTNGAFLWDQIKVSLALDIRDELKQLNALLQCRRVRKMMNDLTAIREQTRKKR